ncbi:putative methionine--tRNA ligase, cytoplasmic [Psilocybe cubensis]|uniref:Methionine--tRNA ligase, cytoplasmic n=2 Tax=Psilocybe cubensis TaxID=181762 RepID=A0ACB8H116_PSICU|nr:putative methionine--tRNA ligase, cytoplasmic [Psilocybe cubensis]KAH9481394.1 putative methionine--tRNA ligase, cytoplasmic [Psilocybe cubensis]
MVQKIRPDDGFLRVVPPPGLEAPLPKEGEKNILITSSLPYCNNVPHLGNIIGSTLSADVFSRYARTRQWRTLYICGTDEYGTATETQALKEGITPRELCDKYYVLHKETYEWFDIGFDHFGRTSTPIHSEIAQEIYTNLGKNDLLEKQEKEQIYCEGCPKFLADRYVEGVCPHCAFEDARGDQCDGCGRTLDAIELIKPRCIVDKTHTLTTRISSHMYLKLDSIQPRTEEWIKQSWKAGKWSPNSVINADGEIVDPRLKNGLLPTPLTRDLKWGVPVPYDDEDKLGMAGKFDAPIGYPSITAHLTPEWKQWWFNPKNVDLYQFMGKDNVYFHTVYWPSVQIGDGRDWTKLHHLSTTEYLNYEGGKFSKGKNRGVFGPAAKETGIPASVWRYYLLSSRPETADAMFSWAECIAANNNVLLNNFGNFVNRALKFVSSQYNSVIPESGDAPGPYSPNDPDDAEFITNVNTLLKEYIDAMDSVKIRLGLQTVMHISSAGNTYLQSSGLNKALMESNPTRCAQVISRAINLIYALSTLIYPFMPATSESILSQLNAPARVVPEVLSNDILGGHTIGKPEHLFKKIDDKMEEVWKAKFGGKPAAEAEAEPAKGAKYKKKKGETTDVASDKPKSEEAIALETKVAEQGQIVRELKAKTPKTPELDAEIKAAVEVLKSLKVQLAAALL